MLTKSTAQHRANGTYRADRHKAFPLTPSEPPPPPEWLPNTAKEKWTEVAGLLASAGVLTLLDLDALAAYCTAFAAWRTACETVEREGQTYQSEGGLLKAHPAVAIMANAVKEMLAWGDRLALTPAARVRLRVEPPSTPDESGKAKFFREREAG